MGCGKKEDIYGTSSCVCEVVRAIKDIQDNAEDSCECESNCFSEPLGSLIAPKKRHKADTRVFTLSTADGSPFHAFYTGADCTCVSIFFRVEDVFDNCCAVLRVLAPVDKDGDLLDIVGPKGIDLGKICDLSGFKRTSSCITVDLKCFCAVQCIADVDLDICD